jgi:hypothetical protein
MLTHQTTDIQDPVEDVDIAFRLCKTDSRASFFQSRKDIRCGNWHQFDITQPLEREEASKHITFNKEKPTNYISISTSPRRIYNLVNRTRRNIAEQKNPDPKIAVLDLRVLRRLGIAYGSSTEDLRFHHSTGTDFATKHHILVLGWLPPQSILGFLSIEKFEALLKASQIDKGSGLFFFLGVIRLKLHCMVDA